MKKSMLMEALHLSQIEVEMIFGINQFHPEAVDNVILSSAFLC